jgi:hypothetical protein
VVGGLDPIRNREIISEADGSLTSITAVHEWFHDFVATDVMTDIYTLLLC